MNDPIADMLNRIHTASLREHRSVSFPARKITEACCAVLVSEGYVASSEKKGKKAHKYIEAELQYIPQKTASGKEKKTPALSGFRRVSKLSQRVYVGSDDIGPVKDGHGVSVISTPKGVLTGRDAKKQGVGGELLFEVW